MDLANKPSIASIVLTTSVFSIVVEGFQSGYTRLYESRPPVVAFSSGNGSNLLLSLSVIN